eukprot:CAMPEP_0180636334 /NCGR_PEP_ID=MMETSP1037_2-20121125/43107_1 /TAXON_ID=632150 /ORGANISM="Azadinium spinosum, Strain 3D9" /LENGTH=102 /DNA_ID=CAMNT_0022657531 /DNA_START=431 /DNA_END=739 /DNA_ORIENTATION=-
MVAPMQLPHQHHVADFAVLVRLGSVKEAIVDHRDRGLHACFEALETADVGNGRDHTPKLLVIHARSDSAQYHTTSGLHTAVLQVFQQQVAEQEVAKIVSGKT